MQYAFSIEQKNVSVQAKQCAACAFAYDIMSNMSRNRKTSPTVLIVIPSSRASRIEKLGGIYRYLSDHGLDWDLRFFHDGRGLTDEHLVRISDDYDGIIATGNLNDKVIHAVLHQPKPIATIAIPSSRTENIAFVTTDNRSIGISAARFLLKSGDYRCFVGIPAVGEENWSMSRLDGFASTIAKFAPSAECMTLSSHQCETTRLTSLIKKIQKPAALFATCDYRATDILRICQRENIPVPKDISVISIDCDTAFLQPNLPSPTYLQTDFDEQGYQAAALLHKLFSSSHNSRAPLQVFVGVRQITIGKSTPEVIDTGKIVERATKFIRQNVRDVRHVNDVVKHLRCSRRLIDLRFKEAGKGSVLRVMTEIRLNHTALLLKTTNWSISRLCHESGWASESRPKVLFKKRFGVSMSDWRKQVN